MNVVRIQKTIAEKKQRRELYLAQETKMLSDGVQQYGVGSRNLMRYNTDLKVVQDTIERLGREIEELEAALAGVKPRKVVGVIPRDW